MKPRSPAGLLIGIAVLAATLYGLWKFEQLWSAVSSFMGRGGPSVTEVMTSGETIVMRTPGGTLEVARIKAYENLRRTDPGDKLAWGLIETGDTVSEIDVAALYRYHIDLAQEWPMRCDRGVCVVRAGPIKPSPPPGIYSEEMRKRTISGWARFNKNQNLAALERSMTAELSKKAMSERNMLAATDAGRRTVREFVRTWMVKSRLKPGEPAPRIVVLFPGETAEPAAPKHD
jgi:hypothetical protein